MLASTAAEVNGSCKKKGKEKRNVLENLTVFFFFFVCKSSVLFAHASKWKSLNCVTNPYRCVLGGSQQLVACSGQPLDNLLRFSPITSRLEAACSTLRWRHVCPTAPDTLACYPAEEDPFVLTNSPHLLVFGNQPAFESRKVKETTVLLVPSFEHSKSLVLFNLSSGHVSSIKFTVVE